MSPKLLFSGVVVTKKCSVYADKQLLGNRKYFIRSNEHNNAIGE